MLAYFNVIPTVFTGFRAGDGSTLGSTRCPSLEWALVCKCISVWRKELRALCRIAKVANGLYYPYEYYSICSSFLNADARLDIIYPSSERIAHLSLQPELLGLSLRSSLEGLTTSLLHALYIPLLKPILNDFLTRLSSPL